MTPTTTPQEPPVYRAVRAVGVLRPTFQPNASTAFADKLDVRGTAFWLREERVLVTCAHVVQDIATAPVEVGGLLVVGNRGNYARATVAIVDFAHDLAILHFDAPDDHRAREASDGLALASSYPTVGVRVGYAGFPLGTQVMNSTQAPTYSEGVVGAQLRLGAANRKQIQVTGAVVGGFSGAPVVATSDPDRVVGVLSNSPSREAGTANIFMAISWEHVVAIVRLATS